MTEHWQDELEKVDLLEPSEDLQARVGHVATPDRGHGSGRRVPVIAAALVIFAAAAAFSFRAFDGGAGAPQSLQPGSSEIPDVVTVNCAGSTTEVTPEASVTDTGIRFRVSDPGNADEVIIVSRSDGMADMDLSTGTEHTFEMLPPGEYKVGCFTDQQLAELQARKGTLITDYLDAPGMVSTVATDPNGFYVSDALSCPGDVTHYQQTYADRSSSSSENFLRTVIDGLKDSDILQRSAYPAGTGLEFYRVVRDGSTIATMRLATGPQSSTLSWRAVDEMASCDAAGLSLKPPG